MKRNAYVNMHMHVKRYYAYIQQKNQITLTLARFQRNIPDFSRAAYHFSSSACNIKRKSTLSYGGIPLPPPPLPNMSAYNRIMLSCNMIT